MSSRTARAALRAHWRLGLWLLASPGWSLVAGVPEPPRPGPLPEVRLSTNNDFLGGNLGENPDDFRTAGARLGLLLGERWLTQIDYSILTNKGSTGLPPSRSDQLTATLGYALWGDPGQVDSRPWIAVGIGARANGRFGGEQIQNGGHVANKIAKVELPYDDGTKVDGVAYIYGSWLWVDHFPITLPPLPFLEHGRIGLGLDAGSLLTTRGGSESEVAADLVAVGQDGALYIGLRQQWNRGPVPNNTTQAVAGHEDGTWLTYGASAGGWFIKGEISLRDQSAMGEAGWMWVRPAGRAPATTLDDMVGEIGFYGSLEPGVQFRWQPSWLHGERILGGRMSLLLDYRFGDESVDWPDNQLTMRQGLIGTDLAWRFGGWFSWLEIFAQTGVGIRGERILADGPAPRYPEASATTGVIQAGAGLRVMFSQRVEKHDAVRYGLSVGYDAWLPFTRASVAAQDGSGGRADFLEPGTTPGVRLLAEVSW